MEFTINLNINFTDDDIENLLETAFAGDSSDDNKTTWSASCVDIRRIDEASPKIGFINGEPFKLHDKISGDDYILDIEKLRQGLNQWLNAPENYSWLIYQLWNIDGGAGEFEFSPLVADEIIQYALFDRLMFC